VTLSLSAGGKENKGEKIGKEHNNINRNRIQCSKNGKKEKEKKERYCLNNDIRKRRHGG
jgi:hypothetical protein